MAPEQIEGAETDARTDVFALGLVLFEMLTGRKAFEADSRRSLMVAILDRDSPQLSTLQPRAPEWLDDVVRRCLEKNLDNRWQTARDVLLELQAPRGGSPISSPSVPDRTGSSTESHVKPGHHRRRRLAWAAAIVLTVAAGIVGLILATRLGRDVSAPLNGGSTAVQKASLACTALPIGRFTGDRQQSSRHRHRGRDRHQACQRAIDSRSANQRHRLARGSHDRRRCGRSSAAGRSRAHRHRAPRRRRLPVQPPARRATDDVLVWGRQIDVSQQSLFTIEDQVSSEVVSALQLQITSTERARLSQLSTKNPDVYSEYPQGRALMANYSDSNLREAMNHFERALQIDQDYSLANAGLAMAAGIFSVRFAYEQQAADWGRRAEAYASRALKQDASLAEAHLALASAAGTLYRNFDWPTVIREAQVALTLNPNLDLAHSALARAFYHVGLLDWSEAEAGRAAEISGGTQHRS